ncbi:Exodeoxyribonuclease III [Serratia symbiotica]|nr:Exodeoxyribonuclease III [Serratia symbiotica]
MKFISFNINGLRAHLHQLSEIITKHQPDIIGLQETKVHDDFFPLKDINHYGYHIFYYGQKSYYGVAFLIKNKPIKIHYGFKNDKKDLQRRCIIAQITTIQGILIIINCYCPQGENKNNIIKFSAKKQFYQDLQSYIKKKLSKNSLIMVMGDMNISYHNFDIGINEQNRKRWLRTGKSSFLPEEKKWMKNLLNLGLIDTYRYKNPIKNNEFSWFDYRSNGIKNNRGLRIDLILVTNSLIKYFYDSGIDYKIRNMNKPSDHAPIWAEFSF